MAQRFVLKRFQVKCEAVHRAETRRIKEMEQIRASVKRGFALAVLLGAVSIGAARADPPDCSLSPCRVAFDGGGVIADYEDLAVQLVERREPIEFTGKCMSACTVLADRARPFACIRPSAAFFIHQATDHEPGREGERFDVGYSRDIAAWIAARGGQPRIGWLRMSYEEAKAFWPTCGADGR